MTPSDPRPGPTSTSTSTPTLLTFGHGTLDQDGIVSVLRDARVRLVVDVRRFPGSRRHPHVARDELVRWLPGAGVEYRWDARLGGRRHRPAGEVEADTWWKVAAFRAYAAHTRSPEFAAGLADLLRDVDAAPSAPQHDAPRPGHVAVMCSESVWWRCHRRLISDVVVLLHRRPVEHLGHDGRRTPHPPADGARVTPSGLVYDDGAPPPEPLW